MQTSVSDDGSRSVLHGCYTEWYEFGISRIHLPSAVCRPICDLATNLAFSKSEKVYTALVDSIWLAFKPTQTIH